NLRWALTFDEAARSTTDEQKRIYAEQAAQAAYEVTQLTPDFGSGDRDALNTLGYLLAERGTEPKHFQEAIRLTRASLKLWDSLPPTRDEARVRRRKYRRALLAADSLSWALFKAGRYSEARKVGEEALRDIRAN